MGNSRWLKERERGTVFGMRLLFAMIKLFGLRFMQWFINIIIFYFYATGTEARRSSRRYLKKVFLLRDPQKRTVTFWEGYTHFQTFVYASIDKILLWQEADQGYEFETVGEEQLLDYLDKGVGCVIVGAHVGNFEMLRVLSLKQKIVVNAVMNLENAEQFNRFMREINPSIALNIIHLKDRNIDSMLDLKSAVDAGEVVAILADRFYPSARERSVELDFLGETALFPASPWVLAHVLSAPLFFAAGMNIGYKRYKLELELVTEKVILHRKNREKDIEKLVTRYIQFLERLCISYPYQWYNFFDFWSKNEKEVPAKVGQEEGA